MATKKKALQAAAGAAGAGEVGTYADDVFSTYVYTGNGTARAISNKIALGSGVEVAGFITGDGASSPYAEVNMAATDSSNNIYTATRVFDNESTPNEYILVRKWSANFESLLWETYLDPVSDNDVNIGRLFCTQNNNLYFCGSRSSRSIVIKIDTSDGSVDWSKRHSESNLIYGLCEDDTGTDLYVTGYSYNSGIGTGTTAGYLAKLAVSNGGSSWTKNIYVTTDETQRMYDCVVLGDYVYVCGYVQSGASELPAIAKFDTSGALQASLKHYRNGSTTSSTTFTNIQTDGTDLFVVGYQNGYGALIVKLDADLSVAWDNGIVLNVNQTPKITSFYMDGTNAYLFGGTSFGDGNGTVLIKCSLTNGASSAATAFYNYDEANEFYAVIRGSGSKLILTFDRLTQNYEYSTVQFNASDIDNLTTNQFMPVISTATRTDNSSFLSSTSAFSVTNATGSWSTDTFDTPSIKFDLRVNYTTHIPATDGEGGMVWIKSRSSGTQEHALFDTERGATKLIKTNSTGTEQNATTGVTNFNPDGFSFGTYSDINGSGDEYASWTFRKAPGFFDVVTYTGDGVAGRDISHNLGCTPAVIIVKSLTVAGRGWVVWHKSLSDLYTLKLHATDAQSLNNTYPIFGLNSDMNSSTFRVGLSGYSGVNGATNASGDSYVAYLFADGDDVDAQIFGANEDEAIIKCGSYTGTGSNGNAIDCGFEPQFVITKRISTDGDWAIFDCMRGVFSGGGYDARLAPNASNNESTSSSTTNMMEFRPSGFAVGSTDAAVNGNNDTYIYIAIRRPHKPAESGTEVFALSEAVDGPPTYAAPFPVDMAWRKNITVSNANLFGSRLTGINTLASDSTAAESTNAGYQWDFMDGWASDGGATSAKISWMFKRSPGFFDVVCYEGNDTAGNTIKHNLGVVPEMMIFKGRTANLEWVVYHKGLDGGNQPETHYLWLDSTNAEADSAAYFNDTAPTSDTITLGSSARTNDADGMIAFLFASQDGISKVGSYTGTQADNHVIDCGFTTGARFVLIKKSGSTGDWYVWDSERGITSTSNDPYLKLNSTVAEATESSGLGADAIQPHASGFQLMADTTLNGAIGYIYLAIA